MEKLLVDEIHDAGLAAPEQGFHPTPPATALDRRNVRSGTA